MLNTQYKGVRAKTCLLGIEIMCEWSNMSTRNRDNVSEWSNMSTRNRDNVSEWSNMSTRRQLFQ